MKFYLSSISLWGYGAENCRQAAALMAHSWKSLFVLYLFELTVIRAAAGQGPLEKSPSPCLLTDPSVLPQTGFVPSQASRPWKEPPIKPLEPVKSEATLECLFWLGRMRGSPSPCRPRSLVSIFSLASTRCERCERSFTQATQLSRHQRMPNECKPITESPESIEVD